MYPINPQTVVYYQHRDRDYRRRRCRITREF